MPPQVPPPGEALLYRVFGFKHLPVDDAQDVTTVKLLCALLKQFTSDQVGASLQHKGGMTAQHQVKCVQVRSQIIRRR